jgi:hypothetical protein
VFSNVTPSQYFKVLHPLPVRIQINAAIHFKSAACYESNISPCNFMFTKPSAVSIFTSVVPEGYSILSVLSLPKYLSQSTADFAVNAVILFSVRKADPYNRRLNIS